ncbi:hypothetical protein ZWY2020_050198 [Hordeum vulgare]|nr:hypothetical protein ZWY2020_050198 [Hordeum vulgare]
MSKDQIDALKGGAGQGKRLSTFKAVVAHVWRCACKARGLAATEDTRLYMTADARSRVHPPLPRGYFGNAIFRASAATKVGDVASGPLDAVAEKVTGATARLDDEYVRSLLDHLELQAADASGLRKGEWVMPETDLWVISWQGLPIYGADFGWGGWRSWAGPASSSAASCTSCLAPTTTAGWTSWWPWSPRAWPGSRRRSTRSSCARSSKTKSSVHKMLII